MIFFFSKLLKKIVKMGRGEPPILHIQNPRPVEQYHSMKTTNEEDHGVPEEIYLPHYYIFATSRTVTRGGILLGPSQ